MVWSTAKTLQYGLQIVFNTDCLPDWGAITRYLIHVVVWLWTDGLPEIKDLILVRWGGCGVHISVDLISCTLTWEVLSHWFQKYIIFTWLSVEMHQWTYHYIITQCKEKINAFKMFKGVTTHHPRWCLLMKNWQPSFSIEKVWLQATLWIVVSVFPTSISWIDPNQPKSLHLSKPHQSC